MFLKPFIFKYFFILLIPSPFLLACEGEDRSKEEPLKPVVQTSSVVLDGTICRMEGMVEASPNSGIKSCGFFWGNDTISQKAEVEDVQWNFSEELKDLLAGKYYCVAYATNGMGTSYGDTIYFEIP